MQPSRFSAWWLYWLVLLPALVLAQTQTIKDVDHKHWTGKYDRGTEEFLAIQSMIANAVLEHLGEESLPGSAEPVAWQQNPLNLTLQMPEGFDGKHAVVFKIERRR